MIALSPRELRQRRRVTRHHERTCEMTYGNDRSKADRIARLRERIREAKTWPQIVNAMLGVLDLLADEL